MQSIPRPATRHTRRALTVAVAATLALTVAVGSASAEVNSEATVEIVSETEARVTVKQTWTEQEATDFRQSLDVIFGDGNGKLTPEEIERIRIATKDDVQNKSFPMVRWDGSDSQVTTVDFTLENAEGDIASNEPISTRHMLTLALTAADAARHRLQVDAIRNGSLMVKAPAGWTVSDNETADGTQDMNATMKADQTLTLFVGPAMDTGPNGNETEQEATDGNRGIPAPSVVLTVAAVAAIAVGASRVARRRSG